MVPGVMDAKITFSRPYIFDIKFREDRALRIATIELTIPPTTEIDQPTTIPLLRLAYRAARRVPFYLPD